MLIQSDITGIEGWSTPGAKIDEALAVEKFALKAKLDSYSFGSINSARANARIRVIEGDLTINGHLMLDWNQVLDAQGLIVTGDLTVNGIILNQNVNGGPFLWVGGRTQAHSIVGGGAELVFQGDAVVKEIVVGEYNDGILRFKGNLSVPVAVTNDHDFEIAGGLEGRWLDPFDEGHSWSAVLHPEISVPRDAEGTEEFEIDDALVPRLLAGQPVLRADLPPAEDYPELFE